MSKHQAIVGFLLCFGAGITSAPTLIVGKQHVPGSTPQDVLDGLVTQALQDAP